MFLLSATKKGFSSKEIQKQLGLKRYEPVWAMAHKLRKALGDRDARYTLEGMIELDEGEGHFTVESSKIEQQQQKVGRGGVSKENVLVMAGTTPVEDMETGKKEKHCRYFKPKVLEHHQAENINEEVKKSIGEQSIMFSDQSTSYVDIAKFVVLHITEKSTKESTETTLKWVHIAIGNSKRNLLGKYHKIKRKYLQLYLNKFVYKLN